jgi:hypothetical protein
MKNNKLILAVIPGAIAIAAIVLSLRSPVSADSIVGYGSVIALLGLAALEYRISWKRVFSR